ncbi:MAG: T9SS type A sorting domain-containing protein [Bacteroidota bacterium]
MKKLIYSLFALLIGFNALAVTTITSQDFSGATVPAMPSGWWQKNWDGNTLNTGVPVAMGTDAWQSYGTTNKFAVSESWFNPVGQADRWMYSPQIAVPATGEIYLQWTGVSGLTGTDGDGYDVKISTTDTARASFTTSIFSIVTESDAGAVHNINLNAYRGQNIYLAWINNTDDGYYLIIDDIKMIVPDLRDAVAVSFSNINTTMTGGSAINIGTNVYNNGSDIITSLDMTYTINGGAPVNANITGLNIAPFTQAVVSHTTPWTPGNGTAYAVNMTINNVNGLTDAVTTNNTITKNTFTYPSPVVARTPLFEVFTASTCPPCNPGNANFHSIVDTKPQGDFVAVKYQQDFPGTGDPYATTESVNRRGFYNINSIPRMEIDGGWDGNANSFTETLYNDARNVSAFADMSGIYTRDDAAKKFDITVNYTPKVNLAAGDAKLYVAILEGTTSQNVKTNGETEFKQVMKKMVPNETGSAVAAVTAGTPQTYTATYTFNGSFRLPTDGSAGQHINHATENSIEEITDCYVVAWLQFAGGDKVVLQAANLQRFSGISNNAAVSDMEVSLFPNPAVDMTNLTFNVVGEQELTVKIIDAKGQVVEQETGIYTSGKQNMTINTKDFANGNYTINVSGKNANVSKSLVINH